MKGWRLEEEEEEKCGLTKNKNEGWRERGEREMTEGRNWRT